MRPGRRGRRGRPTPRLSLAARDGFPDDEGSPPDRSHRYVFTLYALKAERLGIPDDATFEAFATAVLPPTIASQSFTAHYGPAKKPLPT